MTDKTIEVQLKRELLTDTINVLKRWVCFNLVCTDKVQVMIENTNNGTVDEVSIKFNKPFEMRPGCDTVFLALHYKDADTTYEGNHFRFHYPNYGLCHDLDKWAPVVPVRKHTKILIAHHAIIRLVNVLEEIKDFCNENGWRHFDPSSGSFPYDLVLDDDKYNSLF